MEEWWEGGKKVHDETGMEEGSTAGLMDGWRNMGMDRNDGRCVE